MDYLVKIDEFEGPLDLLLHLVNTSNISVYDINISDITKQYLDYINKMEELNIEVASEYLVMAATLMEIKSKSLLPKEEKEEVVEEEDINTEEALINRLVEYQKYKEISKSLKELELSRMSIHTKAPSKMREYIDEKLENTQGLTVDDLVLALEKYLKRKNMERPIETKVTNREYSVKKRKSDITNYLKQHKKAQFTELFDVYNKEYVVVTFVSLLELAKESVITISQEGHFKEIFLELRV